MTLWRRLAAGLVLVATLALALPGAAFAQDPAFGQPSATAGLGQPLSFSSTVSGVGDGTVEVLVGLVGREPKVVLPAESGTATDTWQTTAEIDVASSVDCACHADGPSTPNTKVEYQFRVRAADGTTTLGPARQVTVNDDRFVWQTFEEDLVRVHWYEGDEAFAHAAADVANGAIDRASELLGATLPAPVDLFIYATQDALLEAVSPNRESIAGQAHSNIATMFVWIPPSQDPAQAAVIVAHELTHLVFNEATDNDYHAPPRWLNEGVATYLSEGYSADFQARVNVAAQDGTLIPLSGLAGLFPAGDDFFLAYGESVAAVDYFVRTYSEQTLWDLVQSYRDGLSDDNAFEAATGADVTAFNAAWMGSLGAEVREPLGPQPAPPGPVPSGWGSEAQPTSAPVSPDPGKTADPGQTDGPGQTAGSGQTRPPSTVPIGTGFPEATASPQSPTASQQPSGTPGTPAADNRTSTILLIALVGVALLFAVLMLLVLVQRSRSRRPPPPPPQQPFTY